MFGPSGLARLDGAAECGCQPEAAVYGRSDTRGAMMNAQSNIGITPRPVLSEDEKKMVNLSLWSAGLTLGIYFLLNFFLQFGMWKLHDLPLRTQIFQISILAVCGLQFAAAYLYKRRRTLLLFRISTIITIAAAVFALAFGTIKGIDVQYILAPVSLLSLMAFAKSANIDGEPQ